MTKGRKRKHTRKQLVELIKEKINSGEQITIASFGNDGDRRHWFKPHGGLQSFIDDVPELKDHLGKSAKKRRSLLTISECKSLIKKLLETKGKDHLNSNLKETEPLLYDSLRKYNVSLLKISIELGIAHLIEPIGYFNDFEAAKTKFLALVEENPGINISQGWLKENNLSHLASAISNKHGGSRAFMSAIGLTCYRKEDANLTLEKVKSDLFTLFDKHGIDNITQQWLIQNGYRPHLTRIAYTEGVTLTTIKEESSHTSKRLQWKTPKQTLNSFRQLIEKYGEDVVNAETLKIKGLSGAQSAACRHFGGIPAIRKILGIENMQGRPIYQWASKEQVIDSLEKLIALHGPSILNTSLLPSGAITKIKKYFGGIEKLREYFGFSKEQCIGLTNTRRQNIASIKAELKALKIEVNKHGCTGLSVPMMIAIIRQGLNLSKESLTKKLDLSKGEDLIKGLETNELTPDSLIAWAHSEDDEPTFNALDTIHTFEPASIDIDSKAETDFSISTEGEEHLEDEVETLDLLQPLDPNNQFKALEALTILADDPETLEFLKGDAKRELWALAYTGDSGLNQVINACQTFESTKPWTSEVKAEMLQTIEFIQSLNVPKEYNYRVNGQLVKPHLMQWAVAARVLQGCQTLLVMSDMGTGKSLAAQLAVMLNGSQNILVIAKNECTQQWVNDFSTQWNGLSVHQIALNQIHQGVSSTRQGNDRHVYVMPSHYFSMMSDEEVLSLAEAIRFDAVILDEIHVFKSRDEGESNRKRQVTSFLSQVQSNNPERIVLGLSGTVIVNSMDEGRSLLELVTCQERPDLNQGKGLEKAQRLHQALMANGIRQKAAHVEIPIQFNRPSIDASHFTDEVKEIIKLPPRLRPHRLEKLFISSKVSSIIEAIDGPTIIATQYVDGFVDVIEQAALEAGYKVGVNTGDRKHPCFGYDNAVEAFKAGAIEVLIGSIETICTGIDGFQNVCSNMVIASMPWTAANYQQLIKRIARHGQTSDKVVITIPRTFIEYFDKVDNQWMTWSFCDYRQSIIDTKQRLMDAVIDGYVPDDVVSKLTEAEVGKKLGAWLERISEDNGVVEMPHRPLQVPLVFKDTTEELKTRRKYGEFSRINGRWNSSSSQRLHQRLLENPQEWELYHTELEAHRAGWNVDPLQECINYLGQSKGLNIGDFGCGTAQLADALQGVHNVFSFDHVAFTPNVIACDIAEGVPLEDKSLDVAVFSLSLMGSNWKDQLTEARRCLKDVGQVIIWNAASSIESEEIQRALNESGFALLDLTAHDKWIYIRAAATLPAFAQG